MGLDLCVKCGLQIHLPLHPPLAVAKVSFIVQQERPRSAMMNCGATGDFPPSMVLLALLDAYTQGVEFTLKL